MIEGDGDRRLRTAGDRGRLRRSGGAASRHGQSADHDVTGVEREGVAVASADGDAVALRPEEIDGEWDAAADAQAPCRGRALIRDGHGDRDIWVGNRAGSSDERRTAE